MVARHNTKERDTFKVLRTKTQQSFRSLGTSKMLVANQPSCGVGSCRARAQRATFSGALLTDNCAA